MQRAKILGALLLSMVTGIVARPLHAQGQLTASLADDLIILTSRLRGKGTPDIHQHLGPGPGSMESVFTYQPGAPRPLPGEPSRASTPGQANITPPSAVAPAPMPTPIYGALEIPAIADEGPPNGLTLDGAIDVLLEENRDLRLRFKELNKAQADIITAGLRNNPFVFGDVGNIPYQQFSPRRPGGVNYEITVIQSWDVNQKRKSRIQVAESARSVVEYLYQDSVRLEIDNLYTLFLDVLTAREAVRQQQIGLEGMEQLVEKTRARAQSTATKVEVMQIQLQAKMAARAVSSAQSALRQAKLALAARLFQPLDQIDSWQLRGAISGFDMELPSQEQLLNLALQVRPDVNAFRLGVHRAQTEVQMARADRWADVFLLWTPWQLQNNSATGQQNANSWSFGALATLPVFNRNQGNISRAQITVAQTIDELQKSEQTVVADVYRAYEEYSNARKAVRFFNDEVLPLARQIHDDKLNALRKGSVGIIPILVSQREYNDVVRQYLEASVHLRRAALHLNTAVGQRIVP